MDITEALAPTSDQLDAVELVEPRTFTIDTGSRIGQRDGKAVAEIRLVGFDRVWRPSKGMLDVLADLWGVQASAWVGHRVTLYNDRDVMLGREKVGGIRISHMSHIDGPQRPVIRASGRGRKQTWPVQPLTEPAAAPPPTPEQIAECTDETTLRNWWIAGDETMRALVTERVDALRAAQIDAEARTDRRADG